MADQKSKSSGTPRSVITTPSVIMTGTSRSPSSSSGDNASLFRSNFATSPGGATPTSASTTTSTTTAAFFSRTSSSSAAASPTSPSSTIQYDHETYLELLAGKSKSAEKTASQIYREVRRPGDKKEKKKLTELIGTSAQAQPQSEGPSGAVGAD